MKYLKMILYFLLLVFLSACAPTLPLDSPKNDNYAKTFPNPPKDKSGLYLYRSSALGYALTKAMIIDDKINLVSVPFTYYYLLLNPGLHKLCINSEFSPNCLFLQMYAGENYFVQNYIKMGLFVGGADLEVSEAKIAKQRILKLKRVLFNQY